MRFSQFRNHAHPWWRAKPCLDKREMNGRLMSFSSTAVATSWVRPSFSPTPEHAFWTGPPYPLPQTNNPTLGLVGPTTSLWWVAQCTTPLYCVCLSLCAAILQIKESLPPLNQIPVPMLASQKLSETIFCAIQLATQNMRNAFYLHRHIHSL